MTGFCGSFVRRPHAHGSTLLSRNLETAKKVLSRSGDKIQTFSDSRGFLAFFDNGAFQPNRTLVRASDAVACVSGDPILVRDNGIDNDPAVSAEHLCVALIGGTDDVLRRTTGSFAAAVWNSKTATLALCADKLALRPVYVYSDPALCLFATNLRTLRELAASAFEIDDQGFAESLFFSQQLGGRTIYKNVHVLRPAEIATIEAEREVSRRYFDWCAIPRREADESVICDQLHEAFIRAIRRRSRRLTEEAFLSGGLDSRAVVAGLLDIGRRVRTFGSSYRGSADDVIGRMVAGCFRTDHTHFLRDPYDFLLGDTNHALYAKRYFIPEAPSDARAGRIIWSGDGGSVGLGHVYLAEATVDLIAKSTSNDALRATFKGLEDCMTRVLNPKTLEHWRRFALESLRHELDSIIPSNTERRLFLFYLLNDQMRHLYLHFEEIDAHGCEFVAPFFDMDFLSLVVASPIKMFLRHRLYNSWLNRFKTPAESIPWQTYPGHEPGPHPMPPGITSQWTDSWYRGRAARQIARRVAAQIFASRDPRVLAHLSRTTLGALWLFNYVGIERYNYELWRARRLFQAITGEPIRKR